LNDAAHDVVAGMWKIVRHPEGLPYRHVRHIADAA
jgi:hypothetical protein